MERYLTLIAFNVQYFADPYFRCFGWCIAKSQYVAFAGARLIMLVGHAGVASLFTTGNRRAEKDGVTVAWETRTLDDAPEQSIV
ncbi:hypothetical protein [Erwinia sp. OLFS4]|uniref:hypothetical protein n=1 Tax=Erwinia sp. OLFS4 TaxID=1912858 RepID=UPI00117748B9|nr:hypothetical protein [Erwinia sp. OLFS4]